MLKSKGKTNQEKSKRRGGTSMEPFSSFAVSELLKTLNPNALPAPSSTWEAKKQKKRAPFSISSFHVQCFIHYNHHSGSALSASSSSSSYQHCFVICPWLHFVYSFKEEEGEGSCSKKEAMSHVCVSVCVCFECWPEVQIKNIKKQLDKRTKKKEDKSGSS
jgi:hypothetical protein